MVIVFNDEAGQRLADPLWSKKRASLDKSLTLSPIVAP